jgi:glutaredoxin
MVWLTWLGLPLVAIVVGMRMGWIPAIVVLGVGVAAQILYVRTFPRLSRVMGYGSVDDVPAAGTPARVSSRVTLYTASACPFCPIVRRRLTDLQKSMGFELHEVDVTFQPQIIRAKGLRSVPVIEANDRVLVGNVTSQRLAEFITSPG